MNTTMSKTEAIRQARKFVSMPQRSRTGFVVYGPYNAFDPKGSSTEFQMDNYAKALSFRTPWIARIALNFMGKLDTESAIAAECCANRGGTVKSCVEAGLAAFVDRLSSHGVDGNPGDVR